MAAAAATSTSTSAAAAAAAAASFLLPFASSYSHNTPFFRLRFYVCVCGYVLNKVA